MDSYHRALSFWQAQPARQRHWTLLTLLTLACVGVGLGWIRPQWAALQQSPQRIQQLQTEWQNLSSLAQQLQQQRTLSASTTPGQPPQSDEAALQTLMQMLNNCGAVQLQSNQLKIDMQTCSASQVSQVAQWLDAHTTWQTKQVALEASASPSPAWQGTWVWQR